MDMVRKTKIKQFIISRQQPLRIDNGYQMRNRKMLVLLVLLLLGWSDKASTIIIQIQVFEASRYLWLDCPIITCHYTLTLWKRLSSIPFQVKDIITE